MGISYFPLDALDPDWNNDYSRRARELGTPTHAEIGALADDEWLCRLYFFPADSAEDLVISVCGTGGVAATEARWRRGSTQGEAARQTHRLDQLEASVFRDRILRIRPWELVSDGDGSEAPRLVTEFMEPQRYACLAFDRPLAHSPAYELVEAFCDLWVEQAGGCRKHLKAGAARGHP